MYTNYVSILLLGFSLGLAPAMWALGRPEGLFLLCFISTLYLGLRYQKHKTGLIGAVCVLLTCLCCLSAHPKSIFFAPLFIAIICLIKVRRCSGLIRFAGVVLLAKAWLAAIAFYGKLYNCPDAPFVRGVLSQHMLNPSLALSDPQAYISKLWFNLISIGRFPSSFVAPNTPVFWGWLPVHDLGRIELLWSTATLGGFWLLLVLTFTTLSYSALRAMREKNLDGPILLASILIFCELGLIAHQTIAHHYDGAFHAGIFALSSFIGLARIDIKDPRLNLSVWKRSSPPTEENITGLRPF